MNLQDDRVKAQPNWFHLVNSVFILFSFVFVGYALFQAQDVSSQFNVAPLALGVGMQFTALSVSHGKMRNYQITACWIYWMAITLTGLLLK